MKNCRHILIASALAGVVPAAMGQAAAPAPDERFGVMTHFAQGWDTAAVPLVARAGLGEVRDEVYWREVEPQPGVFSFPARDDGYLGALRANQVAPLITLSFENDHYDGGATPWTDAGIAAYARYGVEVLRHYGAQIAAVEIWNEYNGTFCHGPATKDRAGTYLRMLRAAYAAIKRERPDVTVVGGATIGVPLPYWEKLLAGGALNSMDALSVHPYRYDAPPEGLEDDIAGLQALVRKYNGGKTKPIWVTEIGWKTKGSQGPGDLTIDEDVQAQFLVRAYALLLSAGVQRVYWYLFRDHQGLAMGLVHDDAKLTPKPAYTAMTTLIRELRDAHFVRREPTPPDLYSIAFARDSGEEVRVLWSLRPRSIALRGATAAVDLRGRNLALAEPVTLNESPVFVAGPLTGLPPAAPTEAPLADSMHDFSGKQGEQGWSYGVFVGASTVLVPVTAYTLSDWQGEWGGGYPYLVLAAGEQHPSVVNQTPVAAVRRWSSAHEGPVRVVGKFQCATGGDGVGVSVLVDGRRRFRRLLGGATGNPVVENFDFVTAVHRGSAIDFAVDPGPAADINGDATTVAITISPEGS